MVFGNLSLCVGGRFSFRTHFECSGLFMCVWRILSRSSRFSSVALSLYRDTDPNSVFSLLSCRHSKFYVQLPNPCSSQEMKQEGRQEDQKFTINLSYMIGRKKNIKAPFRTYAVHFSSGVLNGVLLYDPVWPQTQFAVSLLGVGITSVQLYALFLLFCRKKIPWDMMVTLKSVSW